MSRRLVQIASVMPECRGPPRGAVLNSHAGNGLRRSQCIRMFPALTRSCPLGAHGLFTNRAFDVRIASRARPQRRRAGRGLTCRLAGHLIPLIAVMVLYHARADDATILGSRYVARWEPNRRPVRRSLGLQMRVQPRSAGSSGAWITQPEDRGTHLKMTGSQMRIATALRWRAIFLVAISDQPSAWPSRFLSLTTDS